MNQREIKFRAWDKVEKCMVQVAMLDLRHQQIMRVPTHVEEVQRIDDFDLMQYTDLRDKNGKEIYEGDIVNYVEDYIQEDLVKRSNGVVEYTETDGAFTIDGRGTLGEWGVLEVIGNIYENPELLPQ